MEEEEKEEEEEKKKKKKKKKKKRKKVSNCTLRPVNQYGYIRARRNRRRRRRNNGEKNFGATTDQNAAEAQSRTKDLEE